MNNNMNNNLTLRGYLFDALKGIQDKDDTTAIARAEATAKVAQAIISGAKLEILHARNTGQKGNDFLGIAEPQIAPKLLREPAVPSKYKAESKEPYHGMPTTVYTQK